MKKTYGLLGFSLLFLAVTGIALTGCNARSGYMVSNAPDGSAKGSEPTLDSADAGTGLPGPFRPNASVLAGRQLFEVHCSGCHPGGQNRIMPNKPVLGSDELGNLQRFSHYLRNPGPGMQVFSPADLPEGQVQQLYVVLMDAMRSTAVSGSVKP